MLAIIALDIILIRSTLHFLHLLVVVGLLGERRIIMDEKAEGGGFTDTESSVKMRKGS